MVEPFVEAAGIEPAPDSPGTWIDGFRRALLNARPWHGTLGSYLYAIQEGDDGPLKLGIAVDPADRLKTLQIGNPRPLRLLFSAPANVRIEAIVHAALEQHRVAGEWFYPEGDVLDFLHELQSWGEVCEVIGEDADPYDIREIVRERVEARAA